MYSQSMPGTGWFNSDVVNPEIYRIDISVRFWNRRRNITTERFIFILDKQIHSFVFWQKHFFKCSQLLFP